MPLLRRGINQSLSPLYCSARCSKRLQSTTAGDWYHPKVRALPFAISPEEAIIKLAPFQALASGRLSVVMRSLLTRWLPFFGSEPLRPVEIMATYLPGWFVDAEVEGEMETTVHIDAQDSSLETTQIPTGPIIFTQSYMPGVSFDPLCHISMRSVYGHDSMLNCVPFTAKLQRQQGTEVNCLPYTLTPFSIVEAARRGLPQNTSIPKSIRVRDPSTLKCNVIAAYPLLIPVYFARYTITLLPGKNLSLWTALEASSKEKSIMHMNNPEPQITPFFTSLGFDGKWFEPINDIFADVVTMPLEALPFTAAKFTERGGMSNSLEMQLDADRLDQWIRRHIIAKGAIAQYEEFERTLRGDSIIDFDDLRIREYGTTDADVIQRHIDARAAARILETTNGDSFSKDSTAISDFVRQWISDEEFQRLDKSEGVPLEPSDLIQATKPEWLQRWEQRTVSSVQLHPRSPTSQS